MFQLMKEWEIIDTGILEPILGQLDGGSMFYSESAGSKFELVYLHAS
jgi:hypothetical protein